MLSDELIASIDTAFKRSKWTMVIVALIIELTGIGMILMAVLGLDTAAGDATNIGVIILGIFMSGVAGLMFYTVLRPNPVVDYLRGDPAQVVWIYEQQVLTPKGMAQTTRGNLMICTSDGRRHVITTSAEKAHELYQALKRELPNTVFDYTDERHRQFKEDPQSVT